MPQSRHRRKGERRPRVAQVRHDTVHDPDCPGCSDPHFDFAAEWHRTLDCIDRYGWFAQAVLGDRAHPPYTYTAGLTRVGHPEIVVVGMEMRAAYGVLERIVEPVLAGHSFVDARQVEQACGCATRFVAVTPGAIDLGVAACVHGRPVSALQCVWSAEGRYPGDEGYPELASRQPLLGPAWWA